MATYIRKYRPFFLFLGKFFLSYLLLAGLYQFYLSHYDEQRFEVDPVTRSVAYQAKDLLVFLGADANASPHPFQPCIKLFYKGKFVARIIEGCNAISVMILFVAFVIAFSGRLKTTILYIIAGSLVIHVLNVARIALLSAAMYRFPEQEHFLHGVVFPLFIYCVVFSLWVIWVNKYSLYADTPKP
ncbi:MAG: exosortase family protein XrtF [Flavobacterium sp.]|nr:MAG: exosortase family protein XrtF [Flavobacterium sp.]